MAIEIKDTAGRVLKVVEGANLRGANLRGANLQGADLWGADLGDANLRDANLQGADLQGAYLGGAYLRGADLQGAYLRGADLRGADLRADLQGVVLVGANLQGANLQGAYLRGADLQDAKLSPFQICPEKGYFRAFKKVGIGNYRTTIVIEIEIAASSPRTSSLVGRKCRAQRVRVIPGQLDKPGFSLHDNTFVYPVSGEVSVPDYDPDIRVECTRGIHFFMTREEAEKY